jgi:hypothetical protein
MTAYVHCSTICALLFKHANRQDFNAKRKYGSRTEKASAIPLTIWFLIWSHMSICHLCRATNLSLKSTLTAKLVEPCTSLFTLHLSHRLTVLVSVACKAATPHSMQCYRLGRSVTASRKPTESRSCSQNSLQAPGRPAAAARLQRATQQLWDLCCLPIPVRVAYFVRWHQGDVIGYRTTKVA